VVRNRLLDDLDRDRAIVVLQDIAQDLLREGQRDLAARQRRERD